MSEMRPEDAQAVPFFAQFLEGQYYEDLSDEASEAISGGKKEDDYSRPTSPRKDQIFTTLKFPSDGEDSTEVIV